MAELGKLGNFGRENIGKKKLISYQNNKMAIWEKVSSMLSQVFFKILLHFCVPSGTSR